MKKLAAAVALLSSLAFSGSAFAAQATGNAQVLILTSISFVEDQIVDFKDNYGANGTCTMAANGALTGDCGVDLNGTPGQFTVSGTANQSIAVSVGSGSTSGGVTYNPILASNGATSENTTFDGSGDKVVSVIGNIVLASATPGLKALTYVITVNYQ